MFKDYEYHANYHETDQMGCVHHSNSIYWMEETRINMTEWTGYGYRSMGEAGITSPVLEISCQYRTMMHFDNHILIRVRVKVYSAVCMILSYEIRDKATGELQAAGESNRYFLNKEEHPVSLKRTYPTWSEAFQKVMAIQNT